jgi:hypothetical protein
MPTEQVISGSCLCGAIRYSVSASPLFRPTAIVRIVKKILDQPLLPWHLCQLIAYFGRGILKRLPIVLILVL